MADIAATDVTTTLIKSRHASDRITRIVKIQFGNGALTYPAGGIPITIGNFGCPNVIEFMHIFDQGTSGYMFSYDNVNKKIIMQQAPAQSHNHDILLKNAAVSDGATTRVNAGANLLGANTGGDLTVTGGGANGGIVTKTLAAATLVEASTIAVAAQTLFAEVVGW